MRFCLFAIAMLTLSGVVSAASISDFSNWTPIADPVHPGMSAQLTRTTEFGAVLVPSTNPLARLDANGAVPSGTDIGYASVNGADVASSTAGYYFSPDADFKVATDFNLLPNNVRGALGIGFGIGEDIAGANSAGIGLAYAGLEVGSYSAFVASARVDDIDKELSILPVGGFRKGTFTLDYRSSTGDLIVGVVASNDFGGLPQPPTTYETLAIQNQWHDEPLLVSFFLRSQSIASGPPIVGGQQVPAMQSGSAAAYFSNFRVLSGSPITIPEPTSSFLATLALLASWRFPRQR